MRRSALARTGSARRALTPAQLKHVGFRDDAESSEDEDDTRVQSLAARLRDAIRADAKRCGTNVRSHVEQVYKRQAGSASKQLSTAGFVNILKSLPGGRELTDAVRDCGFQVWHSFLRVNEASHARCVSTCRVSPAVGAACPASVGPCCCVLCPCVFVLQDVLDLINYFDTNSDERIDFDEFLAFVAYPRKKMCARCRDTLRHLPPAASHAACVIVAHTPAVRWQGTCEVKSPLWAVTRRT